MKLKMDLSKDGLFMFFKDWQLRVLKILWDSHESMTSSDINSVIGDNVISKSSIVFFLEEAFEHGLLEKTYTTGRGGTRSVYKAKYNENDSTKYISEIIIERLYQI